MITLCARFSASCTRLIALTVLTSNGKQTYLRIFADRIGRSLRQGCDRILGADSFTEITCHYPKGNGKTTEYEGKSAEAISYNGQFCVKGKFKLQAVARALTAILAYHINSFLIM
ncbi:hypothetical protein AB0758_49195 [Tolypothrix bouteillei VB521301_2]|uniref:hypothetical protein n=1 Tax=Tolypothrix bouteillei TaxID=1246981 RepID=UPI0005148749